MYKLNVLLLAASFTWIAPLHAHNVWLEPSKQGALELVYGHASEELQEYDPAKIRVVRAYAADGSEQSVSADASSGRMVIKPVADTAMVNVEFDNGFWTQIAAATWENRSKRHFDKYLDASHSLKYSKNLLRWHDQFKRPAGMTLEVVPLENPLKARPGDKITIQVFYQGKPLPGAGVEVLGSDETFKTDTHGKAQVALNANAGGLQEIAAYYRYEVSGHLDANEIAHAANLVFRLP